jgi:hypothetical protein
MSIVFAKYNNRSNNVISAFVSYFKATENFSAHK